MGIVTDPETIVGKVFKKHEICMAVLDNRCYDLLLEHQQGMILLAPPRVYYWIHYFSSHVLHELILEA